MNNSSMRKDTPSITRNDAVETLNAFLETIACPPIDKSLMAYCSWPELFPSSCGPFHGIGCQAFTTFRMEAWVWDQWAVVFTGGKVCKTMGRCLHRRESVQDGGIRNLSELETIEPTV